MGKAARMAAQCGHTDVVRLLLDRGAELNLDLFCHGLRHGSLELAGLVLDRAPASLRSDSELALELAVRLAECTHTATLDLLLERHFITQHIYDVALARGLAKAVGHNDIALASALLPAGASANATTAGLRKPLLFKAVAKGIDMVKLLLDYGAAPSVEFTTGGGTGLRTPLDRAVSRGAVHIVELLLKRGAEPKVSEDMPRFAGQGVSDCLTLIQRAKRQSFVDSLRC
jgi:ankyrin repeat protein